MRTRPIPFGRRDLCTSLLLVAVLFRAYVPIGFMPANGIPFLLELCPDAASIPMSMPMPAQHHHHSGTDHNQFQGCPFGGAPVAGPINHLIGFAPSAPSVPHTIPNLESPRISARLERAHQPRGPPTPS